MDIAKTIRNRRKRLGLSQVELSVKSGVSLPTIQLLEAGRGNPTLEVLKKLERILGFKLEIRNEEPDWVLLQKWALPLLVEKSQKYTPKPKPRELMTQLCEAVNILPSVMDYRLAEGIVASLFALRRYYPTLFSYFFSAEKMDDLFSQYPKGRLIKLSRISGSKLARII